MHKIMLQKRKKTTEIIILIPFSENPSNGIILGSYNTVRTHFSFWEEFSSTFSGCDHMPVITYLNAFGK